MEVRILLPQPAFFLSLSRLVSHPGIVLFLAFFMYGRTNVLFPKARQDFARYSGAFRKNGPEALGKTVLLHKFLPDTAGADGGFRG
jgi:hypothetical protein